MRIAICHYHLQLGGVTRIILHTVRALNQQGIDVAVIAGEPPPASWDMPCRIVPALHYDNIRQQTTADKLHELLVDSACDALGAEPDIWHFHNHSLGKNLALPAVIRKFAEEGRRLLLHIHDFPEDGRPVNYSRQLQTLADGDPGRLSRLLYPSAPHVHYALLNSRDLRFMKNAGAAPASLHLLANPVDIDAAEEKNPSEAGEYVPHGNEDHRLWLYPTRAIRRKNIGEFLLWSARASGGKDTFALTTGPQNPAEKPFYHRWKRLAETLDLPVQFEYAVKTGIPFADMLKNAHAVVTTSVAEGFGMAFLEPWLVKRGVCGRDLPEITQEFRDAGISLPWMYEKLMIPVHMIDLAALALKVRKIQSEYLTAYAWDKVRRPFRSLPDAWIRDSMIDFGCLDEEFQADIIRHLREKPDRFSEIIPHRLPAPTADSNNIVESNTRLITRNYSLEAYGRRILKIYKELLEQEPEYPESLNGTRLLENFLTPERLTMLRMSL